MQYLIDLIGTHIPQITGALIMAFIVAYLAGLNSRRNRRAVAAAKFMDAFHTELKGLYPIPSNWPKDFTLLDKRLRESFVALQSAIAEFKRFVPWYRRRCFSRAWRRYHLGKEGRDIDQQYYEQYHSGEITPTHTGKEITIINDGRKNFKLNVDNLLKYAKTT